MSHARVPTQTTCFRRLHHHKLTLQGLACSLALASMRRSFFLRFSSPLGQEWQNSQLDPLEQPLGFQFQAHGLHRPEPCISEPMDHRVSGSSRRVPSPSCSDERICCEELQS
eukprot:CAMPEP_0117462138 /NCGR_PEP_ID=MMETSP0784-20121206/2898_1 /TAXON_ID=39447 /ORGANISM="" /LENGTH=111 /DNA_ID=CAMNT_0005255891 /DNA_START=126 /DNA_END=461 /DNA_ORIENTATION=+